MASILELRARPSKLRAGQVIIDPRLRGVATAPGGGGSVSTFTAVNRDTVSSAGGAPLTLTVTGATGAPSVTLNGVPCTSVVVVNSTTITCVVPAVAAGGPYSMACGGHTLPACVTVLPAPGTVFGTADFDNSTLGSLQPDGSPSTSYVTSPVVPGSTHALAIATSNTGGSPDMVKYVFSNNAVLDTHNPNGIYLRWYQAYDAAAIAGSAGGSSQYKVHLARYGDSGSGQPGGLMIGFGGAFSNGVAGHYDILIDNGLVSPSDPGSAPVANQYDEWQVWYTRNTATTTTRAKVWLNGKLVRSLTHADGSNNMFTDTDDATHHLWLYIGVPFSNVIGTTYVDSVKIADGFIDP